MGMTALERYLRECNALNDFKIELMAQGGAWEAYNHENEMSLEAIAGAFAWYRTRLGHRYYDILDDGWISFRRLILEEERKRQEDVQKEG